VTKGNDSRKRVTKWIRWIARIWSFPIIVYALIVFTGYSWSWITTGVADPHAVEDYPPTEALPPIFMFLSILGLGVAWRWERLGGTMALVFLVAVLSLLFIQSPIARDFPRSAFPYLLSLVVAIPGVLFLVCGWRSRKRAIPNDSA
jgi:hypothetical protein